MRLMSIIKPQKEVKSKSKRPLKIIVTEVQLKMLIDNTKDNIAQILDSYDKDAKKG